MFGFVSVLGVFAFEHACRPLSCVMMYFRTCCKDPILSCTRRGRRRRVSYAVYKHLLRRTSLFASRYHCNASIWILLQRLDQCKFIVAMCCRNRENFWLVLVRRCTVIAPYPHHRPFCQQVNVFRQYIRAIRCYATPTPCILRLHPAHPPPPPRAGCM